jgi:hypothetical protein
LLVAENRRAEHDHRDGDEEGVFHGALTPGYVILPSYTPFSTAAPYDTAQTGADGAPMIITSKERGDDRGDEEWSSGVGSLRARAPLAGRRPRRGPAIAAGALCPQ